MNHPIIFLDQNNKTKLVPAFFRTFQNSYEKKISFSLKTVMVITVIISLNYKKTN